MDAETVVAVMASLDEAERMLAEIRVHQHDERTANSFAHQRARLNEAHILIDRAHRCL